MTPRPARPVLAVGERHEGVEAAARETQAHAGKADAVERQQRDVIERSVIGAVGLFVAPVE